MFHLHALIDSYIMPHFPLCLAVENKSIFAFFSVVKYTYFLLISILTFTDFRLYEKSLPQLTRHVYHLYIRLTNNLWGWNSNTLVISCEELTHWKRPWCWEGLGAGGEGDDRVWDGWMASPTWCTWVWVNSGSWWWTGSPGLLQSMGSQRAGQQLNWTDNQYSYQWDFPSRVLLG